MVPSQDFLEERYVDKKLTIEHISRESGFSYYIIVKYLNKYNIPIDQKRRSFKTNNPKYTGGKYVGGTFFNYIRTEARRRNIAFEISLAYLDDLFLKQNNLCALSGIYIYLPQESKSIGTASLDRIDSSKGYSNNNVQWVHKDINFFKFECCESLFLDYCEFICAHAGLISSEKYNNLLNTEHNYQRLADYQGKQKSKSHPYIRGRILCSLRNCARYRNIPIYVSPDDLWNQFLNQDGRCYYTALPLNLPIKEGDIYNASIDRLNPDETYNKNNVVWTLKDFNNMKLDFYYDYIIYMAREVFNYQTGLCSNV